MVGHPAGVGQLGMAWKTPTQWNWMQNPLKGDQTVIWNIKKQNPKSKQKQKRKGADEDGQTEPEGDRISSVDF